MILSKILDAIYPPSCATCDELKREPFCELCNDALLPAKPFDIPRAASSSAIFAFDNPIADAIYRLKYRDHPDLARPLKKLMQAELTPIDAMVPVPSTARRTIHRGYNPAFELARHLGAPLIARALIRTTKHPQIGLSHRERSVNLASAFRHKPDSVRGSTLALIDDVITTGATASVAIDALLASNAHSVVVLTLAREK